MWLGAYIMYDSGTRFSETGSVFAQQLIELYTASLGDAVYGIIAIAAFTTMFSTTLTTLDASPRAMEKTSELLFNRTTQYNYKFWIITLALGTAAIFLFLLNEMGILVQIATILSFVTAPFYAFLNYRLVNSSQMPKENQPTKALNRLSQLGLFFLIVFALGFVFLML